MVKKQSKGVIARVLVRSNLFFIFFLSLIFLTTCDGYDHEGTSGTGNIAFKIDWQNAPTISKNSVENGEIPINPPLEKGGEGGFERTAPLDCTVSGVSTVSATVYTSTGSSLATGGPWNCSAGSGNIEKVPAGTNRKVVVEGKDSSGNVLYRGEQTGITVVNGQTNAPVTVTVTPYMVPSAPTGVSASAGNGQVTISWSSVSGATSYNIYWSTTSDVITHCNLCNKNANIVSTSYTHTGRTNGTTYYYVVTAVNSSGESSESSQVSATPQSTVEHITVTSPRKGEIWIKGSTYNITWVTYDVLPPMSIYLYKREPLTSHYLVYIIAESILNTGSYSWTIPLSIPAGSYYTIDVSDEYWDYRGNWTWYGISELFTISDTTTTETTVTDIDGNVYNTVTIGTQVWMKENLKVTKYRNGDTIPTTTSSISGETSPKYQWAYSNNESNAATYGRLYTWYVATDSRGLCPIGWHLPTDAEWTTLTDYLGGSVAGGKMKEAGTTHWNSPNTGADNSSGFTALPGGCRDCNGTFGYMGDHGYWWSATESDVAIAWYRSLGYSYVIADRFGISKGNGFSVRCVRD